MLCGSLSRRLRGRGPRVGHIEARGRKRALPAPCLFAAPRIRRVEWLRLRLRARGPERLGRRRPRIERIECLRLVRWRSAPDAADDEGCGLGGRASRSRCGCRRGRRWRNGGAFIVARGLRESARGRQRERARDPHDGEPEHPPISHHPSVRSTARWIHEPRLTSSIWMPPPRPCAAVSEVSSAVGLPALRRRQLRIPAAGQHRRSTRRPSDSRTPARCRRRRIRACSVASGRPPGRGPSERGPSCS